MKFKTTIYGDAALKILIERGNSIDDIISRGNLDLIHEIFNKAIELGAIKRPDEIPSFMYDHIRVMNGLERDSRFKKGFISYAGIINRPCRCFQLKEIFCEKKEKYYER